MKENEINSVTDFLEVATREELEAILYTIFKEWPYVKVKAICRAAVLKSQIDGLEEVKTHTLYKGVKNPEMKLVKEYGHEQINKTIIDLKQELEDYMETYRSHPVTQ